MDLTEVSLDPNETSRSASPDPGGTQRPHLSDHTQRDSLPTDFDFPRLDSRAGSAVRPLEASDKPSKRQRITDAGDSTPHHEDRDFDQSLALGTPVAVPSTTENQSWLLTPSPRDRSHLVRKARSSSAQLALFANSAPGPGTPVAPNSDITKDLPESVSHTPANSVPAPTAVAVVHRRSLVEKAKRSPQPHDKPSTQPTTPEKRAQHFDDVHDDLDPQASQKAKSRRRIDFNDEDDIPTTQPDIPVSPTHHAHHDASEPPQSAPPEPEPESHQPNQDRADQPPQQRARPPPQPQAHGEDVLRRIARVIERIANRAKDPQIAKILDKVDFPEPAAIGRFRFADKAINASRKTLRSFANLNLREFLHDKELSSVGIGEEVLAKTFANIDPNDIPLRIQPEVRYKTIIPPSLSKKKAVQLAEDLTPILLELATIALNDNQREVEFDKIKTALQKVGTVIKIREDNQSSDEWTKSKAKRVRSLVSKGLASKAMEMIRQQSSVAPESARNLVIDSVCKPAPAIKQKHINELYPRKEPYNLEINFSVDKVLKALYTSNRGTAKGKSGLTIDHLQQMARASDSFASALTALLNALVFNAKQTMAHSLDSSRLVALWKNVEQTAVRVIAIQEPIMRLASRLIQQTTKSLTIEALSKYQMGYAVSDATTAIGVSIREVCHLARDHHQPIIVAKLDIAGAFDSVPFSAIQAAVAAAGWPKPIQDFVRVRQERETMTFGDEQLERSMGMPQGSSDSPAIFPLVLDPVLRKTAEGMPDFNINGIALPPVLAYQDDVYLVASNIANMQEMINRYIKWISRLGMRIRPEKGWCYGCNPKRVPSVNGQELPIIKWDTPGIDILGVPFGGPDQIAAAQEKAAKLIENDMRQLHVIPDKLVPEEVKVFLTLSCVPPRMAHLLRHSPVAKDSYAGQADRTILRTLCQIVGVSPASNILHAISVPQRRGGWGLMRLSDVAPIAPRASLLTMILTITDDYPVQQALSKLLTIRRSTSVYIQRATTPTAHLPVELHNTKHLAQFVRASGKLQSYAYGKQIENHVTRFIERLPESAYLRRMPARDYLFATAPKPYFTLGRSLATRLHYMVGLSHSGLLQHALKNNRCPHDGAVMTAPHPLVCLHSASVHKTNMHDCVRAELVRATRQIPGAIVIEEHQIQTAQGSRPDFVVDINGERFGVDVSFCEVATDLKRNVNSILRERETLKRTTHRAFAEAFSSHNEPEMQIVPLVFTSYGTPTECSFKFFQKLKRCSGGEFSVKSVLSKIASISTNYNNRSVHSWCRSVTAKLDVQSFERSTGSHWMSGFRRK